MQIAVTSQNRKTITEHAGKCRKFWIYDLEMGVVTGKRLVEVSMEQGLHASSGLLAEPLAEINILITGSMGPGLHARLMPRWPLQNPPLMVTQTPPGRTVEIVMQSVAAGRFFDPALLLDCEPVTA
jgi:predicted Fe-Mo cluster-binding NifX family protein